MESLTRLPHFTEDGNRCVISIRTSNLTQHQNCFRKKTQKLINAAVICLENQSTQENLTVTLLIGCSEKPEKTQLQTISRIK
jgi:hypothetical protein